PEEGLDRQVTLPGPVADAPGSDIGAGTRNPKPGTRNSRDLCYIIGLMRDWFFRVGKLFLLSMIVIAVGFISFFMAMKLVIGGQEETVPSVVGQDLSSARKALESTRLQLKIRGERYDRNVPRGKISTQLPGAGIRIKKGAAVNVIVSLGNRINPIPDLEGSTIRAAQLLVAQGGFELGSISEIHLKEEKVDQVVTQFPTPKTRELVGNKIDVLINKGSKPDLYVMPDLLGWDINRTLGFLEKSSVKVSQVTYGLYQDVAMGTIVKQFPESGYPLRLGESVRLEVSK
ncbi:MAG TPA: PASTA domain-containing protein, partial [Acidobacteriota bacterium]|nr:PASTA domain-containing protein [Acidobacteriota bacterium]